MKEGKRINQLFKKIRAWRTTRKINKALGIKLYPWQIDFIFWNKPIPDDVIDRRRQGKTTAYAIKLCVLNSSYGSIPLDVATFVRDFRRADGDRAWRRFKQVQAILFGEDYCSYRRRKYFVDYYVRDIYKKLSSVKGLKLRKIYFSKYL